MSTQTGGQLNNYWSNFWHNRKDWENLIFNAGRPSLTAFKDSVSTTLITREMKVSVSISSIFSKTNCIMTFYNPTDQRLSGELNFPLPNGAVISGFALDVNGVLVDGVAVEKEKARITFEKEVRKGVDPGLIEKVQGNNFKTRVYPIEPKSTRQVKVEFTMDLGIVNSRDGLYCLPLEVGDSVEKFELSIESLDLIHCPVVDEKSSLKFQFVDKKGFEATFSGNKVDASNFIVAFPKAYEQSSLIEFNPLLNESHFIVSDFVVSKDDQKSHSGFKKIGIVWDSSFSREGVDKSGEFNVILAALKTLNSEQLVVEVFELRERCKSTFHCTIKKDGSTDELINYLKSIQYDSATNLSSIPIKAEGIDHDLFLFFTDGIGNIGKDIPDKQYGAPIYAFGFGNGTNHKLLEYICEKSGGLYSNMMISSVEQAVSHLGKELFGFVEAEYEQDVLCDVYPNKFTPLTQNEGKFTLLGRFVGEPKSMIVTCHFGIGSKSLVTKKFVLEPKNRVESSSVSFKWAEAKISDLEIFSTENKEEILSLGKKYSIVTSNTSLMVLETLEQHLLHKISPHKSRVQMFKDYNDRMKTEQTTRENDTSQKLSSIRSMYEDRKSFWLREHKVSSTIRSSGSSNTAGLSTGGSVNSLIDSDFAQESIQSKQINPFNSLNEEEEAFSNFSFKQPNESPATNSSKMKEQINKLMDKGEKLDTLGEKGPQMKVNFLSGMKSKKLSAPPPPGPQSSQTMSWPGPPPPGPSGGPIGGSVGGFGTSEPQRSVSPSTSDVTIDVNGPSVQVKAWDPQTPYLAKLKEQKTSDLKYKVYLEERTTYSQSPAFFLDCAEHFFQHGDRSLGLRIICSVVELQLQNVQLYRCLAYKLETENELDLATFCYEKILELRPEYPQPLRDLGLILAKQGKYERAMNLLWKVLIGKWDDRFTGMEAVAHMELNQIIAKAKKLGMKITIPLEESLQGLLDVDIRTVFIWDSDDTCIDLWVNEPDGSKCYYGTNRTAGGGFLSRDIMQGLGPNEYFCRKAQKGRYEVAANYYSNYQQSLTGATIVMSKIWKNWGREDEQCHMGIHRIISQGETVQLGTLDF